MLKKKSIYSKRSKLLSDWLRKKREDAGYTIRSFATVSGLSKSMVNRIETGQRRVDLIELINICEYLEADLHEILDQLMN